MLHWSYLMQRTHRALIAGDTDEAERLATECLRIGTDSGQPDAGTIFAMHLLGVNGQRRERDHSRPIIILGSKRLAFVYIWTLSSLAIKSSTSCPTRPLAQA